MADLATPSAAQISTSGAAKTAPKQTTSVVKPEKPDEDNYKSELAKAEKDLKAAEERMVRSSRHGESHTAALARRGNITNRHHHTDTHRRGTSRPSSTSPAPTTRTRPLPSASRSSAPSSARFAPSSSRASLPAARSWTR